MLVPSGRIELGRRVGGADPGGLVVASEVFHVVKQRTSQESWMSSAGTKGRDLIRWKDFLMSEHITLYSGTRSKQQHSADQFHSHRGRCQV